MRNAPPRFAYIHGFASSPLARKGLLLDEAFRGRGLALHRPDMNAPSFEELTITAQLDVLDRLDQEVGGGPWRLVGSSMGGFVAALWASRNPEAVSALLLLAPGFRMARRWRGIVGEHAFQAWQRRGTLRLEDATGTRRPVHWGLVADSLRWPELPLPPCPIRVIHGRQDAIVPCQISRDVAAEHANVDLIEVDDDHQLNGSSDLLIQEVMTFLADGAASTP